jgi:hypothetical protein
MFPMKLGWGRAFVPLAPGRHRIRCYFRFANYPYAGDSSIDFDVPVGGVAGLRWLAGPFPFLRGRWKVRKAVPGK